MGETAPGESGGAEKPDCPEKTSLPTIFTHGAKAVSSPAQGGQYSDATLLHRTATGMTKLRHSYNEKCLVPAPGFFETFLLEQVQVCGRKADGALERSRSVQK
jgi:hypothetical protein